MPEKPESNLEFKRCLDGPYLVADPEAVELVDRELSGAREHYQEAQEALEEEQGRDDISLPASYALFKVARALLYSRGYRDKGFHCMEIALEALFVDEGLFDRRFITHLKESRAFAGDPEEHVKAAGEFLELAEQLVERRPA